MPRAATPYKLLAALVLLACACPALASGDAADAAQAEGAPRLDVLVHPPRPRPSAPLGIRLDGLPADTCSRQLAGIDRSGSTVVVRLARGHHCDPADVPTDTLTVQGHGRWGGRGVHRVRVEDDGGPAGAPRVLGFRLVQVGNQPRTLTPEAGYWWNEAGGEFDSAGPGIGLNLERQGDTLSVTVLGYGADGRPEWLFGAGPIAGRLARVPLLRLHEGSGPFDAYRAPASAQPAGLLHLEFLSEARAVAWFERPSADGPGITLAPLSIVRFRFAQHHANALLGEWLLVSGNAGRSGGQVRFSEAGTESLAPTLRFEAIEAVDGGFRLPTDDGVHALECEVDPGRPNSPPDRCVLRDAAGQLLVDFTDTALDRMRGWRPDGVAVTALRRPAE
jgi:hypothetical protein